ncbi:protein-glutamate O-methyltransferase CheR [Litoribacter ruber]|uniref:Protein-glutamate O-methyltransferase CheR n=1 Tax=Litoribacter ruber TaxID=702568 RepID=A0AAP2G119_9BACT|nr:MULTISPECIES: protein-glutamate O-methyltransferase CheR [Litoribacter]MBS9523879.1 protein-glutamate O-methyltransferase CheR [Litoribacter alkaliphilus]MBT0811528.1 protein-glutamate O-methyltransferase CheR [Litoribacter ruber]
MVGSIQDDRQDVTQLMNVLHSHYGFDFRNYAPSSAGRRVKHYMETHKFKGDLTELAKMLLSDEGTFAQFVQEFTVNVTEMFRDPLFFLSLRENILPKLATYPMLKFWVAGCSTGEEVYSLAIMLKEEGLLDRSIIYATDLNPQVVHNAKKGIFSLDQMRTYTANYMASGGKNAFSDYYIAKYGAALFDQSLQKHMVFSTHNLVTDGSFNEFQLIMCRNVLIYFNNTLQNRVINLFYESLCNFGFLALGSRESLLFSDHRLDFVDADRKQKIFKRKR